MQCEVAPLQSILGKKYAAGLQAPGAHFCTLWWGVPLWIDFRKGFFAAGRGFNWREGWRQHPAHMGKMVLPTVLTPRLPIIIIHCAGPWRQSPPHHLIHLPASHICICFLLVHKAFHNLQPNQKRAAKNRFIDSTTTRPSNKMRLRTLPGLMRFLSTPLCLYA
jgi:hypothetical protein